VSELRDRLEALAARGTRRGADEVLRAAQRDAQTGAADEATDVDGYDLPIIDDDLPIVALEPRVRRRRRLGSFVASAGIAALVGVGALAVTAMFGSGGAGSPEGAVRQLADAVSNKDALAAVDVLVPSEVRSMRESVKNVTDRAAELKIVDEASKPLEGVDLSVDHLALRTEPLADGYAKVIITSGEISASTHRGQLSALLQKATRNGEDGQGSADLSKLAEDAELPTFVVAVRQDGGWYVSPAYTALEYIREANQYPAAEFGSGKAAELGAATPEDAVKDALHAWQSANWDRLIALAPPDELPVYDYRAMIRASSADAEVDFTIDQLSTTATTSGDTGIVKLEASGTTGSGRDRGTWQVGGTCPSFTTYFSDNTLQDGSGDGGTGSLCLSGDLAGTLPFGLFAGSSTYGNTSGPVSVAVVREDGRWFVSPVTTVLDVIDATVRKFDERSVYTLLGLAYELPPDGTITLGQPFEVPASTGYLSSQVYAFEGRAGQRVIGEINSSGGNSYDYSYSYGELYSVDGDLIGEVNFERAPKPATAGEDFGGYLTSVRLPSDGSYRLVMEPYSTNRSPMTLTLHDLADAPKALQDAARNGDSQSNGDCTYESGILGGVAESCRASVTPTTSVGIATPTTYPGPTNTYTYTGPSPTSSRSAVSATTAPATTTGTTPAPTTTAAANSAP
jgi:hypothetical protein